MIQGVWCLVTMLPVLLLNSAHPRKKVEKDKPNAEHETHALDVAGRAIWVAGILLEAVADYQKFIFRNNHSNDTKFIDSGLWSVSRHPNYLVSANGYPVMYPVPR
jgi:steroid 5-alpha reductase family enzyme